VFLDTQFFKTNNFNFEAKPLKLLKERADEGRASIYITDVVEREVRARIQREVEAARGWYNRLREEAKILLSAKETPFHALPKSLDTETAIQSINEAFDEFLAAAGVQVLECKAVTAGSILDAYFSLKPPFNAGEKRKEFPDAISIEAVSERFKSESVYVISGDSDILRACSERKWLQPLETLDEFLELELADHEDVKWISEALEEERDQIKDVVAKAFSDGYFYLDDQDGEVDSIEVQSVDIEDISLISATDIDGEAAVTCTIQFEADISYDDPSTVVYDEGEKYVFGTVNAHVQRSHWDTFSVTFSLDRVEKTISDLSCSDTSSRSFSAIEYADYK
jgi:hypothetical protein